MKLYHHLQKARFLSRPNRFIAICEVDGEAMTCHVKNTGRCRELLRPGASVWLEESDNPSRKTRYDLICVENRGYTVNMDSQAPNLIFAEWAQNGSFLPGISRLRAETTYGDSRFDFAYERCEPDTGEILHGFAEIKGVTLFDDDGVAFFPDAPTERGVKHIHELMAALQAGYEACICFIIQRTDIHALRPNDATHKAFGDALRTAADAGVMIRAVCCDVTPNSCTAAAEIPIILQH